MRISIVNTHDIIGGAERCSYNLTRHFREAGDDAHLIVGGKHGDDSFVRQIEYGGIDWRVRRFVYESLGWTDTTLFAPIRGCYRWPELRDADVYNLHNMHGSYWNFWTVPILSRRAPVVLTLHDEWLLTGDCAYTYDCEKWLDACGDCPQACEPEAIDRACIGGADSTRFNLRLKRKALSTTEHDSIEIVAPSRWLLDQASKAPHLSGIRQTHIPYGVDLDTFHPHDKTDCRTELSLPSDETLLFAPASNMTDPRKNFRALLDAMRQPAWPRNCRLVVAGRTTDVVRNEFGNLPVTWLGFIGEQDKMASAISACDATMIVSKADNLPYVGLESLACGRPLAATKVGGVPEMIEAGESGWLWNHQPADLCAIADRVARMTASERRSMETAARASAERRFDVRREARDYKQLFNEAIERRKRKGAPAQ